MPRNPNRTRALVRLDCDLCGAQHWCRRVRGVFKGFVQLLDGRPAPDGQLPVVQLPYYKTRVGTGPSGGPKWRRRYLCYYPCRDCCERLAAQEQHPHEEEEAAP